MCLYTLLEYLPYPKIKVMPTLRKPFDLNSTFRNPKNCTYKICKAMITFFSTKTCITWLLKSQSKTKNFFNWKVNLEVILHFCRHWLLTLWSRELKCRQASDKKEAPYSPSQLRRRPTMLTHSPCSKAF